MASSFGIFRKHEKLLIAIAIGVAMFVFVIADPLMSWLQKSSNGGQGSPTATIATWDGGSLTSRELDILRQRRYMISNFLEGLVQQGARNVIDEGGTPLDPTVPNFILQGQQRDSRRVMVGAVTTRILANLAADAGMTVSNEIINHYIREWGLRKVTDDQVSQILQAVSRTDPALASKQLFSGLRELLLGNYYMKSYYSSTESVLPEQRWQDWQRINHRIALESATLPTENFLAEVPEPTDADLQEIYENFKEQVAGIPQMVAGVRLDSPDPGFREPPRVRLQYLQGNLDSWTEKLLDTVTDEEIADYYERNKRTQFVESDAGASLFSNDTPIEEEPATEPESAEPESAEEPATEEPASEEKPEDEPQSSPSEGPAEEATEASTEESSPAEEPSGDESSDSRVLSPFRLASLKEGTEEAPAEESAEPESAEESEPDSESDIEESESDTEEPASEESPESESDAKSDTELDTESDEETEEPVNYAPLEEVSDQIRRSLATDKAVVELDRVMGRAYAALQSQYNKYGGELIEAKSQNADVPAPPAKLTNLGETAAELGLVHEELALLSPLEMSETIVGKAADAQTRSQSVGNAAFFELELYEPFLAQDLAGDWYLVIKVEDHESRIPPLEEVKDRVVSAWKQQEAAKLALKRAEELSEQAQESGEVLAGFFADKQMRVETTDLFSWLTFGTTPAEMQRGARLGEAPPLVSIGPEFMKAAFDLEDDQVTAVLSHDHSRAYILRLNSREKTAEELHAQFLVEANDWFGGQIMMRTRRLRAQQELLSQLTERVGLDLSAMEEYFNPDEDQ